MSDASLIERSIQALSDFSRLTGDQQNPVLLQRFSWKGRYLEVKKTSELTWWDRVSQKIYGCFFSVNHLMDQIDSSPLSEGDRSKVAQARALYKDRTIRVLTNPSLPDVQVGSRESHTVLSESQEVGAALHNESAPLARTAPPDAFTHSAVHQVQAVEGHVSSEHVMEENLKACRQYRPVVGRASFLSERCGSHRALALSCPSGGESHLVFLSGNIAERQLAEGRQAAIVNAVNPGAECGPRWRGITRALSDISDQKVWTERTQRAKQEAGLEKGASLATGQCLSIEAPFSPELQVGWLFHALGPNYSDKSPSMEIIQRELSEVYRNIFAEARKRGLDTIECPLISGEAFRPRNYSLQEWQKLNVSFFLREATPWLQEQPNRAAILFFSQSLGEELSRSLLLQSH